MKSIEKIGSTVDVAVTEALIELGASTDQVIIEVIAKGSKGILGIGAKQAKVRVTIKEQVEDEIDNDTLTNTTVDSQVIKPSEPEVEKTVKSSNDKIDHKDESIKEISQSTDVSVEAKQKLGTSKPMKFEDIKDSEDIVVVTPEEIQVIIQKATDFLEKLFKEMDVECTTNIKVINNNRVSIRLDGDKMGTIIGKRGETLDAIQYLANIVANKGRREYIKIMLDTENYRARREETLKNLAIKLSKKAYKIQKPISLEPMNPYDRRIIHSALQNSKFVKTHSEGREPYRKVVITPINQNKSYK